MGDPTRDYIATAINKVFGHNPSKLKIANKFLTEYSSDEATLFTKLDALCACSFSSQANLQNIAPSPEVSSAINAAITASGGAVPDSIALQDKIGSASIQLGTLGSFYSCTSLNDTSPRWIATGSNTLSGRALNDQKCNNCAYLKEFSVIGASKILSDTTSTHVYISTNSSGPCYDVVGSLITQSIEVLDSYGQFALIPSIKVTCSNSVCATTPTIVQEGSNSAGYLIPSLSVTCIDGGCTTKPITLVQYSQILVPSQVVNCTSFPCALSSVGASPLSIVSLRNISCVSSVCSTTFAFTSPGSSYFIPPQSVTCNGTVCSTSNVLVDPISLIIPSQATICTGSSCASIPAVTIADSGGRNFSIPVRNITCMTDKTCATSSMSLSVSGRTFSFPAQKVLCSGSSCMVPDMVLYAGSSQFVAIPSLTVGVVSATAGSLKALCMYELDH